jgi:hypothetical protein
MRLLRWAFVGVLALALTDRAQAQTNIGPIQPNALTGIKPSDVQFKKVDTTSLLRAPIPAANTAGTNSFSLTGIFRRLTGTGTTPIMGRSNIPAPQYQSAVTPLLPVMSTVPLRR